VLDEADAALMSDLDQAARSFLVSASELGKVCCITLASQKWHSRTMAAFLPRTAAAWHELGIEVHYASKERLETRRASQRYNCSTWSVKTALTDEGEKRMMEENIKVSKKRRAMSKVLRRFYGTGASWKNILNFGDSPCERQALWDAAFGHRNPTSSKTGSPKPFRVKTMKMMEVPSCSELREELQQLQAWLPLLVHLDNDLDGTLACEEEARMEVQQHLEDALAAQGPRLSSAC